MEFRIWVETRLDGRILERELISSVERPASGIGPEEIDAEGHVARIRLGTPDHALQLVENTLLA